MVTDHVLSIVTFQTSGKLLVLEEKWLPIATLRKKQASCCCWKTNNTFVWLPVETVVGAGKEMYGFRLNKFLVLKNKT